MLCSPAWYYSLRMDGTNAGLPVCETASIEQTLSISDSFEKCRENNFHGVGEAEVLCMDFCLSSCICVNLFADSSLTLNFVTVHLSRCKRVETVIPEGCYLFGVFFCSLSKAYL